MFTDAKAENYGEGILIGGPRVGDLNRQPWADICVPIQGTDGALARRRRGPPEAVTIQLSAERPLTLTLSPRERE